MPYFSLRDPESESDFDSESSDESDVSGGPLSSRPSVGQRASFKLPSITSRLDDYLASIGERQTCPTVGKQQQASSSKLPSVRSREDYFLVGSDCYSSKPTPAAVVKTPKAIPPKPTPLQGTGSVSITKAPKPILPKATPLHEMGTLVPRSPLAGAISVSESKTPKSSPSIQTSSVSVLKTPKTATPIFELPKPGFPKSSSVLKTPKTANSTLQDRPGPLICELDKDHFKVPKTAEFLDSQSSSCGHQGIPESERRSEPDSPFDNKDFYFEAAGVEVKPKITVPPDWHRLLFGGVEKYCDDILTYPEGDTSYEDCKLAEDLALSFVANYDMPIFDCMRDFNTVNTVSHAVKTIPKKFKGRKEQLVALLLMLDYLSCCCQEGNLLSLYGKCKDKNKTYHIESLDQSIRLLLDRLHSDRLRLDQLHSVDKFVTTCIERIPRSLKIPYFSVPVALKRKLKVFEAEEKSQKENSVYNFFEQSKKNSPKKFKPLVASNKFKPSPVKVASKKLKASPVKATSNKWEPSPTKAMSNKWVPSPVKATSNKWVLEEMDCNDQLRTPTKSGQSASARSPQLASTPQSAWSVSAPTTSNSGSVKRNFFSASPQDGRKGSSSPSVTWKSDPSKITHWLFQKNTPPKTNTGVTSLISKQREMSKEVSRTNSSKSQWAKDALGTDDYSSDDSLPDIPNIVIPQQESSSYTAWKRKLLDAKAAEVCSPNSNLNSSQVKHKATPTCKSPFKANNNSWKSKFGSPSKSCQ